MKRALAKKICRAIEGSSVAVVGDLMLDRYLWGRVERVSPEAPVPVVSIERSDLRPGGAANVAWNLLSLGCRPRLIGMLGKDSRAREIRELLGGRGVSSAYLVSDPKRVTTEKIRIVAHSQQVVRADFESGDPPSGRVLGEILASVKRALAGAGAVLVSDYGKGVVTRPVMDRVRELSAAKKIPVLIDPKEGHFDLYRGASVVTPNLKEAGSFYNIRIKSADELERVGRSLLSDLEAHAVLITRGEEGMTLFEEGRKSRHFPTRASEVYDVTGAGDTVISVLAAAIAAGAGIYDAIELANAAAGLVVRELGTAAVTKEELTGSFRS